MRSRIVVILGRVRNSTFCLLTLLAWLHLWLRRGRCCSGSDIAMGISIAGWFGLSLLAWGRGRRSWIDRRWGGGRVRRRCRGWCRWGGVGKRGVWVASRRPCLVRGNGGGYRGCLLLLSGNCSGGGWRYRWLVFSRRVSGCPIHLLWWRNCSLELTAMIRKILMILGVGNRY